LRPHGAAREAARAGGAAHRLDRGDYSSLRFAGGSPGSRSRPGCA
jgi:hypothetical protein